MLILPIVLFRAMLDTSPIREATSRSVNLFRELFQVVDMIVTKSTRFVSWMISVKCLVLMHAPIWVRMHEHMVLNYFPIDSRLRRRCDSGFPRSMCRTSMLQAKASFRCTQISASRLSFTNIEFGVVPLLSCAMMPLLMMSAVAWPRGGGICQYP